MRPARVFRVGSRLGRAELRPVIRSAHWSRRAVSTTWGRRLLATALAAAVVLPAVPAAAVEGFAEQLAEGRDASIEDARDRVSQLAPGGARGPHADGAGAGIGVDDPDGAALLDGLGETQDEARQLLAELGEVRDELEAAELELAALTIDLEDARGRLQAAEGQVALAETALEEAEATQDAADREHRRADATLRRTERQLAEEEQLLVAQLVHTFKYGTSGAARGAMVIEVLRRAEDPNAFAVGMKQLRTVVSDQDETVTKVFELRERRSELAARAARTRSRAVGAAREAARTLTVLEDLREQAAELAQQVEDDQARQEQLLDELRGTEAETEARLERVAEREGILRTELAERRRLLDEEWLAAMGGVPVAGIVCPVVGAVAGRDFSNDWGYPRSGGRSHQGNDVFAERGTPVVAVADGVVIRMNGADAPTALGGITVTYRTDDGDEWYNAHLHSIADLEVGDTITQGQLIGTVGNTGNARTTPPHLHLGRRVDGQWVNPWPTISRACVAQPAGQPDDPEAGEAGAGEAA